MRSRGGLRVVLDREALHHPVLPGELEALDLPAFSVQYHPEAAAGPHDAAYLFDRFLTLMRPGTTDDAKGAA